MNKLYAINEETLYLEGVTSIDGRVVSRIYDERGISNSDISPTEIIKYGCEYFGSTLEGRQRGTSNLLGIKHKVPVIVEGSLELIFFPTCSPKVKSCSWICFNNIISYKKNNYETDVIFKNGEKITIDMSYGVFENQYIRATRLKAINDMRKLLK